MNKKSVSPRPWWREKQTKGSASNYVVSEEELLNRVLLAKALIAYCRNQPVEFRADGENLEITPTVARDLLRKAGIKLV